LQTLAGTVIDPKPKFATLKIGQLFGSHVLRRIGLPEFKPTGAC